MNNFPITEVSECTNLGLLINNTLNWTPHIKRKCEKVSKPLTVLYKYKYILPHIAFERLYLSMILPVLEYGDIIYDNCSNLAGQTIEQIQRHAALICTGAYRHTENQSLLQELGWETIASRRKKHKLFQYYKIKHRIYPDYLFRLLHTPTTIYNLRVTHDHIPRGARLTSSQNSFFPSTTQAWNDLPDSLKSAASLNEFKRLLPNPNHINIYYRQCNGIRGSWLTRLRLNLSALNQHRYNYHFIEKPDCLLCRTPETTTHYFFNCRAYVEARNTLFSRLSNELSIHTLDHQSLLDTILHGTPDRANHHLLLDIIYQYFNTTKRFM